MLCGCAVNLPMPHLESSDCPCTVLSGHQVQQVPLLRLRELDAQLQQAQGSQAAAILSGHMPAHRNARAVKLSQASSSPG